MLTVKKNVCINDINDEEIMTENDLKKGLLVIFFLDVFYLKTVKFK